MWILCIFLTWISHCQCERDSFLIFQILPFPSCVFISFTIGQQATFFSRLIYEFRNLRSLIQFAHQIFASLMRKISSLSILITLAVSSYISNFVRTRNQIKCSKIRPWPKIPPSNRGKQAAWTNIPTTRVRDVPSATTGWDKYLTKSAAISLYTELYTPSRAAVRTALSGIRVCSNDCRTASMRSHHALFSS